MRYEEYLQQHGVLTYRFRGVSMRPMLRQGKDFITVERKSGRLKKYDVALYRRPNGAYVLHRVVEVCPEGYVILGDNCYAKEFGIREDQVFGVLVGFSRGEKQISVTDRWYQLYARVWYWLYPVRRIFMWLRGAIT